LEEKSCDFPTDSCKFATWVLKSSILPVNFPENWKFSSQNFVFKKFRQKEHFSTGQNVGGKRSLVPCHDGIVQLFAKNVRQPAAHFASVCPNLQLQVIVKDTDDATGSFQAACHT